MLNDTVCLNRRRKSRRRTFEASPFRTTLAKVIIDSDDSKNEWVSSEN